MASQNKDGFFRFAPLRAFRALLALRHFAFFANVIVSETPIFMKFQKNKVWIDVLNKLNHKLKLMHLLI